MSKRATPPVFTGMAIMMSREPTRMDICMRAVRRASACDRCLAMEAGLRAVRLAHVCDGCAGNIVRAVVETCGVVPTRGAK